MKSVAVRSRGIESVEAAIVGLRRQTRVWTRFARKRRVTAIKDKLCIRGPIIESVAFIFGLKIEKTCTTSP